MTQRGVRHCMPPTAKVVTSTWSPSSMSRSRGVLSPLMRSPSNMKRTEDCSTCCFSHHAFMILANFVVGFTRKVTVSRSCAGSQQVRVACADFEVGNASVGLPPAAPTTHTAADDLDLDVLLVFAHLARLGGAVGAGALVCTWREGKLGKRCWDVLWARLRSGGRWRMLASPRSSVIREVDYDEQRKLRPGAAVGELSRE